jgi:hypothetical protein
LLKILRALMADLRELAFTFGAHGRMLALGRNKKRMARLQSCRNKSILRAKD